MPYDVVAANSRATQVGTQLGQAMFNNSLRMQQLQSEQALQRLQQQQAAETLSWTMRQHSMAIDQEAQNAKRTAAFMAQIAPTINVPAPSTEGMSPMIGPDGQPMGGAGPAISGGTMAVPNPLHTPDYGEAYIKAFLPGSPDPAKVIATGGALTLHQAQAAKAKADAARFDANGGIGTLSQLTGDFAGAPTLNVYKHPNGTTELVGSAGLETVTGADGRTYQRQKDGSLKPLAATPDQQNTGRTKQKLLSEALKVDPSQVDENGNLTPDGWAAIQAKTQVTPVTRNVVEKQIVSGEKVISAADEALDTILRHPEAVGLRGAFGSAIERGKGQLGMETDATTAKARQKLQLAFTQLADGLKVDSGNMSKYERNKLEEVGDPSRWQESPQTAAGMMENIRNAAIGQQLRRLHTIGKQPDVSLLRSIPPSEIAGLLASNLLTDDEAFKWRELRRKK